MQHIHLENCDSTQDEIQEILKHKQGHFLVTATKQNQGRGQGTNSWFAPTHALLMSFNAHAHEKISLSALEMGVLICNYLKKYHDLSLQLKWPNDIYNSEREKCGGILITNSQSELIIGVGLNLYAGPNEVLPSFPSKAGFLSPKKFNLDVISLVNYIHANRILESMTIIKRWNELCIHMNEKVMLQNNDGVFIGISDFGEAQLKTDVGTIKAHVNGPLRLL